MKENNSNLVQSIDAQQQVSCQLYQNSSSFNWSNGKTAKYGLIPIEVNRHSTIFKTEFILNTFSEEGVIGIGSYSLKIRAKKHSSRKISGMILNSSSISIKERN